jgi:hypothetical protein
LGEEEGVIIDVDLERSAGDQESGGEEIEIGEEEFSAIEFGADEHAATIVGHVVAQKCPALLAPRQVKKG